MIQHVLQIWGHRHANSVSIYCTPPAGAGAAAVQPLASLRFPHFDIVGVRLSGRESRFSEGVPTELGHVVNEISAAIEDDDEAAGSRRLILGQSSGAIFSSHVANALPSISGLILVSPPTF